MILPLDIKNQSNMDNGIFCNWFWPRIRAWKKCVLQ